jgi:hypothetical protein
LRKRVMPRKLSAVDRRQRRSGNAYDVGQCPGALF